MSTFTDEFSEDFHKRYTQEQEKEIWWAMMDGWSDEELRAYDDWKFRRIQSKRRNRLLGAMDASTLETELPQTDFWNEEQVAVFKAKLNSPISPIIAWGCTSGITIGLSLRSSN
jgi:hypothetical protein